MRVLFILAALFIVGCNDHLFHDEESNCIERDLYYLSCNYSFSFDLNNIDKEYSLTATLHDIDSIGRVWNPRDCKYSDQERNDIRCSWTRAGRNSFRFKFKTREEADCALKYFNFSFTECSRIK